MSATVIQPAHARLQRSQLAVPASNPSFIEKAARSTADVVFLDLEDAVAPNEKVAARTPRNRSLERYSIGGKKPCRCASTASTTEYMYRDVIDVVEACPRLDMLLIPKVGVAADVYMIDTLVTQIELAMRRTRRLGFDVLIETALGMSNVETIAASSRRLEALSFGVGDYAASTRARSTVIGGGSADYGVLSERVGEPRTFHQLDLWQYAQSRMLVACRAYGLRPIDGPFGDYSDPASYEASARRAAALGYEGKWAIHPSQIQLANAVFSPSEDEITAARRIMQAMTDAQLAGRGAVSLDGRLIDIASIKMAENLLAKSQQLGVPT